MSLKEQHSFKFADGKPIDGYISVQSFDRVPFDVDPHYAPEAVTRRALQLQEEMGTLGVDLAVLRNTQDVKTFEEAKKQTEDIHTAAAVIYGVWELHRASNDKEGELGTAKLFNGMTKAARELHEKFGLFDRTHVEELKSFLEKEAASEAERGYVDLDGIAAALNEMGNRHTHENAWAWVVLPTFPKQHYGRILLVQVSGVDERYPTFVTQPTFLSGEGTQFHTHGQNWAFARPVGSSTENTNPHINTMWQPTEPSVFPLRQVSRDVYKSENVVIIPPRAIHGITHARAEAPVRLSVAQLAERGTDLKEYARTIRFAEHSSIHIYRPDMKLAEELSTSPLMVANNKFFIENDMIVFDHQARNIWSGGGGAWSLRMLEHGPEGEHCGACFVENDPRNEHLDPQDILKWYTNSDPTKIIGYSFS